MYVEVDSFAIFPFHIHRFPHAPMNETMRQTLYYDRASASRNWGSGPRDASMLKKK